MAAKITRQQKKIALIGAPSSAAAFLTGTEKAPAALRAAGLLQRLQAAGYEVIDHGDCAVRHFAEDDENRRARNLKEIVAGLNDLKLRAEVAVKSGALVLVLGGDCAQVIGLLTGARRYYKRLSLLWFDRDADLNTPATTPSGRIDGMVVAHIIGKGAPELVRFWGEPPLVREPDVTLFGLERVDAPEQEFLDKSPMRRVSAEVVQAKGAGEAAKATLMQMHADARQFILHVDTDVIAQEEFPAVNVPGSGGLAFADVRSALIEFVKNPNLLGLDVAQYNPDKDSDSTDAKKLVDLLAEALTARLQAIGDSEATTGTSPSSSGASSVAPETEDVTAPVAHASDASTEENSSSNAPNSDEESSSGMSTHETSA
ncbi:MAG TPA: arginase family protein [Verrucomicrobiae bacterium]|nr:arginase family protein [Verrucomicrobiae bacterium]